MISTRSMFRMGFNQSFFHLGDDQLPQADRDQILITIDKAFRDAAKIDAIVARGGVEKALGPNLPKFKDLNASASNIVGQVVGIQEQLQSSVATDWVLSAVDRQRVTDYAAAVNQMLGMLQNPQVQPAPGVAQAAQPGTILGLPAPVVYIGGTVVGVGLILALFRAS